MSAPITGTGNITLGAVTVGPAGPPHTYFGVATAIAPGVEALAESSKPVALPLCLLAAHQAECLLKAYLSRSGDDSMLMNPTLRHDLVKLWREAGREGLPIASTPPEWLETLGHLHNRPFYLRYSTNVHGIVMPAAVEVAAGLKDLLLAVEKSL